MRRGVDEQVELALAGRAGAGSAVLAPVSDHRDLAPLLLGATLARVAALGPRFELTLGAPMVEPCGIQLIALDRLVADPELPSELIDAKAAALGTTERRVAASILFQGTVGRVAAGVLAAAVTERRAPLLQTSQVEVGFLDGTYRDVRLRDVEVVALRGDPAATRPHAAADGAELLRTVTTNLLEQLVVPLRDAVRAVAGNSPLQLRGNAAAALLGIMTRLQRAGAPTALADLRVVAGAASDLIAGTGHLETLLTGSHLACFHARRTCCQMYRIPDSSPCGTCPLRSSEDRQDRWRRAMSREQVDAAARHRLAG